VSIKWHHYTALQHTATRCTTLRHAAPRCTVLQYRREWIEALFDAVSIEVSLEINCNTLQHATSCCNTLQYDATHCNTEASGSGHPFDAVSMEMTVDFNCNALHHIAPHCITL